MVSWVHIEKVVGLDGPRCCCERTIWRAEVQGELWRRGELVRRREAEHEHCEHQQYAALTAVGLAVLRLHLGGARRVLRSVTHATDGGNKGY